MIAVQAEEPLRFFPRCAQDTLWNAEAASTIADGIAVKSLCGRTFEAASRYVDEVVTVDDEEIAAAILYALEEMKETTLEGAGAAALAALLYKRPPKRFPAVMVHSGGNIDVDFLSRITERGLSVPAGSSACGSLLPDRPGSLAALPGVDCPTAVDVW